MRWVRAAAAGVLLVGCSGGTSERSPLSLSPSPPASSAPASVAPPGPDGAGPEGFSSVVVQVTKADGTTESFCVWLAGAEAERERGLMSVTSLGGADGMIFRFGAEQEGAFWMKDTVLPLSIAFFADDGAFVSAADMEPCQPGTACRLYYADGPYADAIEVVQGGLGAMGIGPASRLAVTDRACAPRP